MLKKKQTDKKRFYSYLFRYPTEHPKSKVPFYAGKGTGGRDSLSFKRNCYCENVIKKLQNAGLKPIIERSNLISEEEAFEQEIKYIQEFGLRREGGLLTNLTYGGEGSSGCPTSELQKKKTSEAHKGKIVSEETRKKLSEANMGHTHTEKSRAKMSKSKKGQVPWNKGKTGVQIAWNKGKKTGFAPWLGKKRSEETKKKIGTANKGNVAWNKGKSPSLETRAKISATLKERNKGKSVSPEIRAKISATLKEYNRRKNK